MTSNTAIAERAPDATAIEQALVGGDLSRLTPAQRVSYYNRVCDSLGLNPLTKPFAYILLNGKLVLYALKDCTEQLRKLHHVSIVDVTATRLDDVYVVTAKAQDNTGRTDASTGAVPLHGLKGEALANALMKAETKAKRRVTLSLCGLGMLDESEVASIDPHTYSVAASAPASPSVRGEIARTDVRRVGGDNGGSSASQGSALAPASVVGNSSAPKEEGSGVDPLTGQEIPAGYSLIAEYSYQAPWHTIVVHGLDAQGGAMKLSTKLDAGFAAEQAFENHVPVRLDWKPKGPKSPGEGYLNRVYPLPAPLPEIQLNDELAAHLEPIDVDSIPF